MTPAEDRRDEAATLSRELGELLIELSIGVHRYAMYPRAHPSLAPVARKIVSRLARYFEERDRLNLGVARDQLVIEGVATDSGHPVLSDLARRLHAHELGALTFRAGVGAVEVEELLVMLALEVDEDEERQPIGRRRPEELPAWENVSLHPIGYGDLHLEDADSSSAYEPDRAAELWLGLAQAAMAADEPYAPGEAPDSKILADHIRRRRKEEAYDQVIAGYLLQLADELKRGGREARRVRSRVSGLVRELDEETLSRLLDMGGDAAQRLRFLRDANSSFAADAVVKVLRAAADPSGRSISDALTRLLAKLSQHTRKGDEEARSRADTALRTNVQKLLDGWELEDPNPAAYSRMLDRMSRSIRGDDRTNGEGPETGGERPDDRAGAFRIVEMALEVDTWGPSVEGALTDIVDGGDVARLLALLDYADPAAQTATRALAFVTDPDLLRRLLSGPDVDGETLELVVDRTGRSAVEPLLDALVESESRAVRRTAFDLLVSMDAAPYPKIVERLDDDRWYVVRNLLSLMQQAGPPPERFDASDYLRHPDPRVRREAFRLVLGDRGSRDRVLARGLADDDERIVRMALLELQEGLSEPLVPTLVRRVVRSDRRDSLRALGLRALAGTRSSLAREALLEVATGGTTLLGRRKVAERSAPVLAALRVLTEVWPDEPEVRPLLEAARASGDPEIRDAAAEGRSR